jgi:hypothetical protein
MSDSVERAERIFEGVHCRLNIERPRRGMVIFHVSGRDVNEFGEEPMRDLEEDLRSGPIELFIDARHAQGPSIDVSALWATWLRKHRESFSRVSMLTRSRFVQLTADFVRNYGEMGNRMRIYSDPAAFDTAVALALADPSV